MSAEIVKIGKAPNLSMAFRISQALRLLEHGLAQLPKDRRRSVPEKNARVDIEMAVAELVKALAEHEAEARRDLCQTVLEAMGQRTTMAEYTGALRLLSILHEALATGPR